MPCSRTKVNVKDATAPKPVRPRSMKYHGLLGMTLAAQHLVVDDKWTPDSLSAQFQSFSQLLIRRNIYNQHDKTFNSKRLCKRSRKIKSICSEGRIKLQNVSTGDNAHKISNILSNHRDLQRLYQRMPIHLVVDNINQRTFVMRKERDRLYYRLEQRKNEYKTLLSECAELENRIRYENEFVLKEEIVSRVLRKKIENSNVRIKAIIVINKAYQKLVEILLNDEAFYEPILRSLENDMEDQSNFIKHIIFLGKPAIRKFSVLSKEYEKIQKKSRESLQAKIKMIASIKKPPTVFVPPTAVDNRQTIPEKLDRYVRRTKSMMGLKNELSMIERTIDKVKFVTLCSQAKEIFPSIRQKMDGNRKFDYEIANLVQLYENLNNKKDYSSLLREVLIHLSEEEINRLERIKELKLFLKEDEKFEKETVKHLKTRADMYILLRTSLWNLIEILRSVDRQPKMFRLKYKSSYLMLPLLKFDMLNMYASPPELYEEDLDKLMELLKRKVYKLMKAYNRLGITSDKSAICRAKYHATFLETQHDEEYVDEKTTVDDDYEKEMLKIPNSYQMKAQSVKLIEEMKKRE